MHIDTMIVANRVPKRLCHLLPVHRDFKLSSHAYLVERRLDNSRYLFGICHYWSLVIDGTMLLRHVIGRLAYNKKERDQLWLA